MLLNNVKVFKGETMNITIKDVKYLAELSALEFSAEEKTKFC